MARPSSTPEHRSPENSSALHFLSPALAILVVANAGLAVYGFARVVDLKQQVTGRLEREQKRLTVLASRVGYDAKRSALAEGLEEAIPVLRPGVERKDAARFTELVLDASEKYEGVDPLLLVSVGIVESGYNINAVSHAGARGLYQIYPPTGRLLARSLGWEYSDDLLHDPAKNTELAATYLGILGTAYKDVRMVLAEYNGGPLNAGYFRADADQLAEETRNYVPRVLGVYRELAASLDRTRRETFAPVPTQ